MSNRSQRGAGFEVEGQVDISTVNDRDTGIEFPSENRIQLYAGGVPVLDLQSVNGSDPIYGSMVIKIGSVTGASGSTGVFHSTSNPLGYDVLVTKAIARVTTAATAANCTIDIGVAANAATSNDGLFDGLDVGPATGIFTNVEDPGTNGELSMVWGSTQFLNVNENAAQDVDGLVMDLYIECVRL